MSELMVREYYDKPTISRGMVYGAELDRYVWREREAWAWKGAIAGGIVTSLFWLIALGF